jgi:excinuclease ABC subunit A
MQSIKITDINQNHFKNAFFEVPKNHFIVITGPSGSGKSTLIMDIIYAEGQRKFLSSLPSYVRKFIDLPDEPNIGDAEGLTPCIIIDQKTSIHNARSTVGTISEVYDYLRVLFANIGSFHCITCHEKINRQSLPEIAEKLSELYDNNELTITMKIKASDQETYAREIKKYISLGYTLFQLNTETLSIKNERDITDLLSTLKNKKNAKLEIILYKNNTRKHSIEQLVSILEIYFQHEKILFVQNEHGTHRFTNTMICLACEAIHEYPLLHSKLFSFNLPTGACHTCRGLGYYEKNTNYGDEHDDDLSTKLEHYCCPDCHGTRLCPHARAVFIENKNITDLAKMPITELQKYITITIENRYKHNTVAQKIIHELSSRLLLLSDVGLGYLTLDRVSASLSGGEIQRIRLTAQLGNRLSGVTYILDEPSIGLHQSDNGKLIHAIQKLRDLGNTILVVEHDEETMLAADIIVDIGPGAGAQGGRILFIGTPKQLLKHHESLTANYLSGRETLTRSYPYIVPHSWFIAREMNKNNLNNLDAKIPIDPGMIIVLSGISGSGKSTLLFDELIPRFLNCIANQSPYSIKKVFDIINIDSPENYILESAHGFPYADVILIDQKSIGLSMRSTAGTYLGFFDEIRILYAELQESKVRGFDKGDFSFNTGRFRCEKCRGVGKITEILYPLPNVDIECPKCLGKRFKDNILQIKYKEKNIFDVLMMSVSDAMVFFQHYKKIYKKLKILVDLGLGYITLNQTIDTFSGGEKQRLKLAYSLIGRQKKMIYVFDEPTTGLHFQDIKMLLAIFKKLTDEGNLLFIIEHNLHIIKYADFIIDMGPGGGAYGGRIVATGTVEQIKNNPHSVTGKYL